MSMPRQPMSRRTMLRLAAVAIALCAAGPLAAAEPVKIGLVTALSGQSAKAGEDGKRDALTGAARRTSVPAAGGLGGAGRGVAHARTLAQIGRT